MLAKKNNQTKNREICATVCVRACVCIQTVKKKQEKETQTQNTING